MSTEELLTECLVHLRAINAVLRHLIATPKENTHES